MIDIFTLHPRPWRVAEDWDRDFTNCGGVVFDAEDNKVLWSSEWFGAEYGVLEAIVEMVNQS